eukprot:jgi/Bigna1/127017/aug1.3_g1725
MFMCGLAGADLLWENEKNRLGRLKRDPFFRDYIKILKHNNIGKDGFLYDKLQYIPSNGEICRHYMRPHDRLIMAEESPKDLMRSQLPPRNPNGVVVYDCDFQEQPADFIRYLDRFPQATVMITYNGEGEIKHVMSGLEVAEDDQEASPLMKNSDRREAQKIYERVVKRGFRFVMGCDWRYGVTDSNSSHPTMGGTLIANPPMGFDDELEPMLNSAEEGLKVMKGKEGNYFWGKRTPLWYKKILQNPQKLPYNYQITGSSEIKGIRSADTGRNKRNAIKTKKLDIKLERKLNIWKMAEKGRLRRRYVEDFKADTDPADYIDAFMPRVRRSLKWKPKRDRSKRNRRLNKGGGGTGTFRGSLGQ